MTEPKWGPTGELVYKRTYSRPKPDGTKEAWAETVERVVDGNLALVDPKYHLPYEREDLIRLITEFKILPAGRHLWASGVAGRQYLFNCFVSGWDSDVTEHFTFTFLRLMEGGGVGANYSNRLLADLPLVQHPHSVEIVCDPSHPDYEAMKDAGLLSERYDSGWLGSFVVEDSREGWAAALADLLDAYHRPDTENFYRVFDVSNVRAAGSRLKTFGGTASGPRSLAEMLIEVGAILDQCVGSRIDGLSAMAIDHAIAKCVVSGGVRRSARMAMMHWDDPQIFDFINCKKDGLGHWTTNISVEVDEEFWERVRETGERFELSRTAKARDVLDAMCDGMLHNGEPGFWDSSLSNEGEPNEVICTNPCGEIPLEPWEPCNLGHVNLAAFVNDGADGIDFEIFYAHELMTRFLIRATYGDVNDPKQAEVLARNRRIGVGHLGVASFLALRGIKYSEAYTNEFFRWLLRQAADRVDSAAIEYAHQLRIPVPVKRRTVAPTGSIAKLPGVSEGIHPIMAKYFIRRVRLSKLDPAQVEMIREFEDQGYLVEDDLYAANTAVVAIATKDNLLQQVAERFGDEQAEEIVQAANDLTIRDMLRFQVMYQQIWADNAVSYTVNFDPNEVSEDELRENLIRFGGRLKGATVFPESSMPQAPYERITKGQYEAALAKAVADGVDEECANGACPIR
ncbi:Adenosylcobalamin-dependent ribonucleoside-triphosphate reductase [Nocardia farcinica]|uniref:ribonucleoside-triphosphate reductase, adenosylcobalamin-dependent n=1 Tax=Nocardia farcinica TaxID=37329 RepID=UPI000E07D7C3|nr:ribonucleoside-triphosphate reductase, adenosylcobalamin-dependent [Nocardia farcinica]SUE29569.1 Adenosylcobalamin-dependent ribonucleoside-triphosphate reductase [Nocardia farcinica]